MKQALTVAIPITISTSCHVPPTRYANDAISNSISKYTSATSRRLKRHSGVVVLASTLIRAKYISNKTERNYKAEIFFETILSEVKVSMSGRPPNSEHFFIVLIFKYANISIFNRM